MRPIYAMLLAVFALKAEMVDLKKSFVVINMQDVFVAHHQGTASGFVVDKKRGLVLTNLHVVMEQGRKTFRLQNHQGESAPAHILLSDTDADLAVLRVDPQFLEGMVEVKVAERSPCPGDEVFFLGNEDGRGFVSRRGHFLREKPNTGFLGLESIYLLASLCAPGSSGSPLVNDRGELIGVIALSFNIGTTGAVTLTHVRSFLNRARAQYDNPADDWMHRGFRGYGFFPMAVWALDLPPLDDFKGCDKVLQLESKLNRDDESGLEVGDIILEANGVPVKGSFLTLYDEVQKTSKDHIVLKVFRYGHTLDVQKKFDKLNAGVSRFIVYGDIDFFEMPESLLLGDMRYRVVFRERGHRVGILKSIKGQEIYTIDDLEQALSKSLWEPALWEVLADESVWPIRQIVISYAYQAPHANLRFCYKSNLNEKTGELTVQKIQPLGKEDESCSS